jgi:predicted TIM-barrel fold metal-dependent hydrolase
VTPRVIDVDQHLHEPRAMWREYIDPDLRDRALAIEDDELGYAWLTWQGARLYPAEIQTPGKASLIGKERLRMESSQPAEASYDDLLPLGYTDPKARVAALDGFGLDAAVLFPNFGLLWEESLSGDLAALCGNMRAFNRWMADVVSEGEGRLYGVAHVTLRDLDWLREELRALNAAGIKLAMTAPAPVDGKALSHPDLDPVWRAFVDADVAPVFHVGAFRQPLDPAWYEDDPETVDKLLGSTFLWVAPAVALANMAIHGTLERFPDLRIGVVELLCRAPQRSTEGSEASTERVHPQPGSHRRARVRAARRPDRALRRGHVHVRKRLAARGRHRRPHRNLREDGARPERRRAREAVRRERLMVARHLKRLRRQVW